MKKSFDLEIKGYLTAEQKGLLPPEAGVYFIYAGEPYDYEFRDPNGKRCKEKYCSRMQLLYIGSAQNIHDRFIKHEVVESAEKHLDCNQKLYISFTIVNNKNHERIEAAYIYRHQPPLNTLCKRSFNYEETTIESTGSIKELDPIFTVNKIQD